MRALITTDLHLTDNPREEYRWRIFNTLRLHACREKVTDFLILGDLTDRKDNHSATLVNRIVSEIRGLAALAPVTILKGNHDYLDPKRPYFLFLNHINRVTFHSIPHNVTDLDAPYTFLPHTFDPQREWAFFDMGFKRRAIFMHQTVQSAVASNGVSLDGEIASSYFRGCGCYVFSGDIHVPQRIGRVIYVGAPYPVKFGDSYSPRYIRLDGQKIKSRKLDTIQRVHAKIQRAKDLTKYNLRPGDHLKVTVNIRKADLPQWTKIRDAVAKTADAFEVELFSITPKVAMERVRLRESKTTHGDVFDRYCRRNKLSHDQEQAGREVMKNA